MRTTADIAAIISLVVMGLMITRYRNIIERQNRAIWDLVKVNERLFDKIDMKASED